MVVIVVSSTSSSSCSSSRSFLFLYVNLFKGMEEFVSFIFMFPIWKSR